MIPPIRPTRGVKPRNVYRIGDLAPGYGGFGSGTCRFRLGYGWIWRHPTPIGGITRVTTRA